MKKKLRKPSFIQDPKFYWFNFVFINGNATITFKAGLSDTKVICLKTIERIKEAGKIGSDFTFLNAVPLGYSTSKDFYGTSDGNNSIKV